MYLLKGAAEGKSSSISIFESSACVRWPSPSCGKCGASRPAHGPTFTTRTVHKQSSIFPALGLFIQVKRFGRIQLCSAIAHFKQGSVHA